MTVAGRAPLRIALLHHSYGSAEADVGARYAGELASALRDAGHHPAVLSCHRGAARQSVQDAIPVIRVRRLPDAPLRLRGFAGPLTHTPFIVAALLAGGYQLAHSFSTVDAPAAFLWRGLVRRPVLFTCGETLTRERLADARLRLRLLRHAVEHSDALIAPAEEARAGLSRWLAVDAPVIASHDVSEHERLYRALIDRVEGAG